jgi:flavin reductase (DIM6/NTAB) family NADH-FMN oxidoreductase RutF
MVDLLAENLSPIERYELLIGSVVPRPIAWVTTQSETGLVNLAPFSCFTMLCGTPPLVLISIGSREGRTKDTLRNIEANREFAINSVTPELLPEVARSAKYYSPDTSEAAETGLELAAGVRIKVPRIKVAAVVLECVLDRLIAVGDSEQHHLVIGQVLCYRIRDDLFRDGRIDVDRYLPVGRLGGPFYAPLDRVVRVPIDSQGPKPSPGAHL